MLHTYGQMEVRDPSLVNTDSKMHGDECPPPHRTDVLTLPACTHTNRQMAEHTHMLTHTHTDTQNHSHRHMRRALSGC